MGSFFFLFFFSLFLPPFYDTLLYHMYVYIQNKELKKGLAAKKSANDERFSTVIIFFSRRS